MDKFQAKQIIKAAKTGDLTAVKKLVSKDGELIHALDRDGSNPLHCAAWKGHHEIVEYLIDSGTDVNAENENSHWGTTALHAASHGNRKKVAEALVAKGANINYRSPLNQLTALGHTKVHNAKSVTRFLIEHGAGE